MSEFRVALVVGHSSKSGGAISYNKITEFDYNNELVTMIADNLSDSDVKTFIFYRSKYRDLPGQINAKKPNLIVSFHCNAFNSKASGFEVLYYHKSTAGKSVADVFLKSIEKAIRLPSRGVKGKSTEGRGGYLLRYTYAPCVILEPFFIDNKSDFKVGNEFKNELSLSIAEAILKLSQK